MSRLISRMLGLGAQLFLIVLLNSLSKFFSAEYTYIFTVFTIYIICISLSFTEFLLASTLTIEFITLPSIIEITKNIPQGTMIICILTTILLVSIKIQALMNII